VSLLRKIRRQSIHYSLHRLAGHPTCDLAPSARLGRWARIMNDGGPSERIRIGEFSAVDGELLVFAHGGRISIGQWCYVGPGTRIWSGANIDIGNRVLIAHNVNIIDNQTHPISPEARHQQFVAINSFAHPKNVLLGDLPIVIEDDAWIAAASSLLRGVTIGEGAIVGTGSVVTEDVPPYTIVAGNPARVVRALRDDELSSMDLANKKRRLRDLETASSAASTIYPAAEDVQT
jgi:acetyltransferase-like isoleucine patch superfamily enzyme